MSFVFDSNYQQRLLERFTLDWLPNGSAVSILQGFPGTGKSTIARGIDSTSNLETIFWDMSSGSDDLFEEFYLDLANELDSKDIFFLSAEIDKDHKSNPLNSIVNLIKKYPLLIVIDDFQYCLDKKTGLPSKYFQDLIEKLNKSPATAGKLMLISNRDVQRKRWNDNCFVLNLNGIPEGERGEFFKQALLESNLTDKVPKDRIGEIANRLGGNPRAILILISTLFYDPLEELLSLSPDLFDLGEVSISNQLIMEFEYQLIQRSISLFDLTSKTLLEYLCVYRRPFKKHSFRNVPIEDVDIVRHDLVGKYFIQNTNRGDVLHPVVKEIFVSKIQKKPEIWKQTNSLAADYYLSSFKLSDKKKSSSVSIHYFELRHHLTQCSRMSELNFASEKVKRYLLAKIDKPQQSQIPKNRETLEERIALILLMPDGERPKGLEYHLALCLRERNKDGDFKQALHHIRRAESPHIYYAAWLLRLDLENSVVGIDSMFAAFEESLKYLKDNNNVFAIFRKCAELLHQNGNHSKAIEVLEFGIKASGVHCYSSIVPLCASFMEEEGRVDDAISLLMTAISTPGVTRVVTLYLKCADLMIQESRYHDAQRLLEKALLVPNITKLYSIYMLLADVAEKSGDRKTAIETLKNGIPNCGDEDTTNLFIKCTEMLVAEGEIESAISFLNNGIKSKKNQKTEHMIVALAEKINEIGNKRGGIKLLKKVLLEDSKFDKHLIYIKCADMFFRDKDLEGATIVLKNAILDKKNIDKWEYYHKCADILYRQDKVDQALQMLQTGVNDRKCSNTYVLYKTGSKILVRESRLDDAINFLETGLNSSSVKDKAALCQDLSKLLARNNELDSAIEILKDAINEPGMKGLSRLYKTYAELQDKNGCPEKSISILEHAILNLSNGNIAPLYKLAAEILFSQNNIGQAYHFITMGMERFPKDQGLSWFLKRLQSDQYLSKLLISSKAGMTSENTRQETVRKIEYFKQHVEYRDCYKLFYDDNGSLTANEAFVQYLFKLVWAESKSSVYSEVKNGRGIVDFIISFGKDDTTLIEFKLASNSALKRNLENQTEIYELVNQTKDSFTVIIVFSEKDSNRLTKTLNELGKEHDEKIYIIDARRDNKQSASIATSH